MKEPSESWLIEQHLHELDQIKADRKFKIDELNQFSQMYQSIKNEFSQITEGLAGKQGLNEFENCVILRDFTRSLLNIE